jgi:hypothetical protein
LFLACCAFLSWGADASAATDRDCDDFASHQESQSWFEANGGSANRNAGALDGDRDGVPCESLIRRGGVRGVVDAGVRNWPFTIIGGTAVISLTGGCLALMKRSRRDEPAGAKAALRPIVRVPELGDVPSTGFLVVTLTTDDGGPIPTETRIEVIVPGTDPIDAAIEHDGAVSVTVPTGNHTVRVIYAVPYQTDEVSVRVLRDDVTRLHVLLRRQTTAPTLANP